MWMIVAFVFFVVLVASELLRPYAHLLAVLFEIALLLWFLYFCFWACVAVMCLREHFQRRR